MEIRQVNAYKATLDEPVIYDERYYERRGNETIELKPSDFTALYKRFHK